MKQNTILEKQEDGAFERIRHVDENGNEYWSAREFAKVLEYTDYRNFIQVINKAKRACENSSQSITAHFVEFNEMATLGAGTSRKIDSIKLSRYACYLIVQNADPSKEVIALGQTYFATQTRLQELQKMEEYNTLDTEDKKRVFLRNELRRHNTHLANAANKAGVIDPIDSELLT